MSARTAREQILDVWTLKLAELGVPEPELLALEFAVMAEARGASFNPPAPVDPAKDWKHKPQPGDASAGAETARREIRPLAAPGAGA